MAMAAAAGSEPTGLVFDIQAHSVHDGPGTRTTVFLSGCPLACPWCCNPEGLSRKASQLYRALRCQGCLRCLASCGQGAIQVDDQGRPRFQRSLCDRCESFECVASCYHEALLVNGRITPVQELMALFQRDRQFWGRGGGVTFSGGEPLLQEAFMRALLSQCRRAGINTCVETTACVATDWFMAAAADLDWLFVDLKVMDPEAHRRLTGVDNRLILNNLRHLGESDLDCFVVVRIPVIPGLNDDEANLRASARFVRDCGLEVINLLPFHRLGESKWTQVGREYPFKDLPSLQPGSLDRAAAWIRDEGVTCYTGWETPF